MTDNVYCLVKIIRREKKKDHCCCTI